MSRDGPKSLADLLHNGDLGRLRQEADRRRSMTEEIRARLPTAVAAHLSGAHRDEAGKLVLTADSAAWAARMRYIADEAGLGSVTVRVSPERQARSTQL